MIDSEKIKNEVFGSTEEKTTGLSQEQITDIVKVSLDKRTYISDPSEAPEGANVQEGERGGYYIEDDGGSGGSGGDDSYDEVDSVDDVIGQINQEYDNLDDMPDDVAEAYVQATGGAPPGEEVSDQEIIDTFNEQLAGDGDGGSPGQEVVSDFEDVIDDIDDIANPQGEEEMEASRIWSEFTRGIISEEEFEEQAEEFMNEYAEKSEALSQERITDIVKVAMGKRRYIRDPSEAPEGANVQQGPQGGYYIEDSGGSGGSSADDDDANEVLGAGDKEMYSIAEESVTGLAPEEFDNDQGAMVDHVHDDMMDTIESEMDVDFDSLDDERYDQVTTTIQEYAEEVVGDEF